MFHEKVSTVLLVTIFNRTNVFRQGPVAVPVSLLSRSERSGIDQWQNGVVQEGAPER